MLSLELVLTALMLAGAPEARAQALEHLRNGNAALRADRHEDAIREYETGHQLFPSVRFLYNLGQAYEKAGQKRKAREVFSQFLRDIPGASEADRAEFAHRVPMVEERVAALTAELVPEDSMPTIPMDVPNNHGIIGENSPTLPAAAPAAPRPRAPALVAMPVVDRAVAPKSAESLWSRHRWTLAIGGALLAGAAAFVIVSAGGRECARSGSLGCI